MRGLFLIKRGPKPEYHRAPFHAVIVCDKKRIAQDEAGATSAQAWVWTLGGVTRGGGWLLERWNGLDIDYGHIVHGAFQLPDGSHPAFYRDYEDWPRGVRDLFKGAIWWSDKVMPLWLGELGVLYPSDKFTQQWILDQIADDGMSGTGGRPIPKYWKGK